MPKLIEITYQRRSYSVPPHVKQDIDRLLAMYKESSTPIPQPTGDGETAPPVADDQSDFPPAVDNDGGDPLSDPGSGDDGGDPTTGDAA